MKWLLDTNACIAVIRQRPQPVLRRLRGKQVGHVGLSSITLAELEFGAAKSQQAAQARAALGACIAAASKVRSCGSETGWSVKARMLRRVMRAVRVSISGLSEV